MSECGISIVLLLAIRVFIHRAIIIYMYIIILMYNNGIDTADTEWLQVQLSLGRGVLAFVVLLSILQLLIWHH